MLSLTVSYMGGSTNDGRFYLIYIMMSPKDCPGTLFYTLLERPINSTNYEMLQTRYCTVYMDAQLREMMLSRSSLSMEVSRAQSGFRIQPKKVRA